MKLVIPGGAGQIGSILCPHWRAQGHEVVVLTRAPQLGTPWRQVEWDGSTLGPWADELDGCDVVVNLAGRSVNCRYNQNHRQAILNSRVQSTRILGEAMRTRRCPPRLWMQASTATIYAHSLDAPNDEANGILGGDEPGAPNTWRFSVEVAKAWEAAAQESAPDGVRLVFLRSAMTMSPDKDGVFDVLLRLVRLGLGGPVGNGRQYVSWIHDQDFIRALEWIIDRQELSGPVNLAAPTPLTNRAFMSEIRKAWGSPWGLPASSWMATLGAWAMRTETELVLKSRRVVPGRLHDSGFRFDFPAWAEAARDLCQRWREQSQRL